MKIKQKAKSSSSWEDSRDLNAPRTSTSTDSSVGSVLKVGAIALAFLILGYQISVFVQHSVALKVEQLRDHPDTVLVYVAMPSDQASVKTSAPSEDSHQSYPSAQSHSPAQSHSSHQLRSSGLSRQEASAQSSTTRPKNEPRFDTLKMERCQAKHSASVEKIRAAKRRIESFPFDPNTISVEDLQRLGFSQKQAESIDAYRRKGGRFRRAEDFSRSYVVADSVYRRLEPYINIPKVDINKADSAAFDALPGIGPWFASKMVDYRNQLGGYSCAEQLMEIYNFSEDKYSALSDLIECTPPADSFALWGLPADSLRLHPHVRNYATARGIVFYREHNPREKWTLQGLLDAGVIDEKQYRGLSLCIVKSP